MPSTYLFSINNGGRVFTLSTADNKWKEIPYLGIEFKHLSCIPHFVWAIGGDRQAYVHVYGLEIPIRIKEESYENQRWSPFDGFCEKLLPTDRFHFSSKDGTKDRSWDKITLPSLAWQWEGDWHLETTLDGHPLDSEGWTYALDFPTTYHPKKQWKSCVRRRKWIRYRRYSALNSWCAVEPLHKDPTQEPFIDICVGGEKLPGGTPGNLMVWAVTAHGRVIYRAGVSSTSPEGSHWSSIPIPTGCEVSQISTGPTGLTWCVLWNGRALVRAGVTRQNPKGEFWLEIAPPGENQLLAQVSVGMNAVWAVTRDHRVWFRKGIRAEFAGTNKEFARGSGWVEMVGKMALVSVGTNDQVWGLGVEDRVIYFRTGVLPAELTGKTWKEIRLPTQLSRTSSNASLWSNARSAGCNSANSTPRDKRHRSYSTSRGEPFNKSDEMKSSPQAGSLPVLQSLTPWQRSSDGTSICPTQSLLQLSSEGRDSPAPIIENRVVSDVNDVNEHSDEVVSSSCDIGQDELNMCDDVTSRVNDLMLDCESNDNVFPDEEVDLHTDTDSGVFAILDHDDSLCFGEFDILWSWMCARACTVDHLQLPNWFTETSTNQQTQLSEPWRLRVIEELQKRSTRETAGYEHFDRAVERSSWVKSGKARCCLKGPPHCYEDCIVELEWVGSDQGSLDCGTLTVFSPSKTRTMVQFSLSEITGIVCCSEPSSPRIALHTSKLTAQLMPIRLQFFGDVDMEDWMANITSVCCQLRGVHGPPSPNSIWSTTMLGDTFVFDPATMEGHQWSGEKYTQELEVAGRSTPFDIPLQNGFPPETVLTVDGHVKVGAKRFSINLMNRTQSEKGDAELQDIALHVNPRFDYQEIVRNSMKKGTWENEETDGEMVLKPGSEFTLGIQCEEDCFKILIDGMLYTAFAHRLNPDNVTYVQMNGDITLGRMQYQSKMVIVSPLEMFWRQMGGHLRKAETCALGITWGIGYNNTAWVYTGGWGGTFLKGLCSSSVGINSMSDTHSYYVYENQRWNPVTGYTSRGLPTDRYMWSDKTGRQKRSLETTKLLSMHWQWVTDWAIDYHTPGGVDKEGWQYAVDFPASYRGQKHFTDYVRRRRWVRKCRLNTSGPWEELGTTKLIDVSLQVDHSGDMKETVDVWAIAQNGDALFRMGVTKSCPAGTGWEHVPSEQPLISISAGAKKQVWAIGKNGSAYWRFGISQAKPTGEVWVQVEPPTGKLLEQVSVGEWTVWVVDQTGQLYVRREVTMVFPEGTCWQQIDQGKKTDQKIGEGYRQVSAGPGGEVWAIAGRDGPGVTGVVCRRHGVSPENPTGTSWSYGIGGGWQHICARGFKKEVTSDQHRYIA